MSVHLEQSVRKRIVSAADKQLTQLHRVGGRSLLGVGLEILTGFGMHVGDEPALANRLSRLNMQVISHIPTFTWSHRWSTHYLLRPYNPATDKEQPIVINLPVNGHNIFNRVSATRSLAFHILLDAAKTVHASMGKHPSPREVDQHLIDITFLTARRKNLSW